MVSKARSDAQTKQVDALLTALDEIDVEGVLKLLGPLLASRTAGGVKRPPSRPVSCYFLAMDIFRLLGSAQMTQEQLLELQGYVKGLLLEAFPTPPETLPDYPSMESVPGVNIFHVLALYTVNDGTKAEVFFSALKQAGLAVKAHLRAECGTLKATPLHLAAEMGNKQVIESILRYDPNSLHVTNAEGSTASEIAAAHNFSNLATVLRNKETDYLRKKQIQAAAKEMLTPSSSPELVEEPPMIAPVVAPAVPEPVAVPAGSAMSTMIEMLKGYRARGSDNPDMNGQTATAPVDPRLLPSPADSPLVMASRDPSPVHASSSMDTPATPAAPNVISGGSKHVVHADPGHAAPARALTVSTTHQADTPASATTNQSHQWTTTDETDSSAMDTSPETPTTVPVDVPPMPVNQESLDARQLYRFVHKVCEQVPGGGIMTGPYVDFMQRIGISSLPKLKSAMTNPVFAPKFPAWMRRVIEESLRDAGRQNEY